MSAAATRKRRAKEPEVWHFDTATAAVRIERNLRVIVHLSGVLTPPVIEALCIRLASKTPGLPRTLFIGDDAIRAVTSISTFEAAARGTPPSEKDTRTVIKVPRRSAWESEFNRCVPSWQPWSVEVCGA